MERLKKEKRQRRKAPRLPIKTYRWEDVRRARLRGGYPWTYLYKEPFTDQLDPNCFIMEPISKSKSSSPLPKFSERLDIKDVTYGMDEQESLTPEPSGYIVITEVPSDSESHSRFVGGGSVIIEDIEEPEILNLESAESSDNISQYLDKEEPPTEQMQTTSNESKAEESGNGRQQRAKSEEPKRKRKLSIDSSYSRKSLSKLAFLKKLKEAKDKIKIPKLSLSKLLKSETSEQKEVIKQPEEVKTVSSKKKQEAVSIHIPLKPPEGETDEFSYLEFGDKKPEEPAPEEVPKSEPEVKQQEEIAPPLEITIENVDSDDDYPDNPDDIVAFEILKRQSIDMARAGKNGFQGGNDYLIIQEDDNADAKSEKSMIIIMPSSDDPSPTLSRTSSKKKSPSRQGSVRVRAKSAEPEKKRKLSIESAHSRRSLSKLSILKKLKDVKEKFKFPKLTLSRSNSKKDAKKPKDEIDESKKETVKEEPKKRKGPDIIHIPLKPPPGETDEFSYLEFEEKKTEEPTKQEESTVDEQSPIESPASAQPGGVQFIFLTAPSDDEILDQPDIPETPSSTEGKFFFGSRINELKELAQGVVDKVSPKPTKKVLQSVEEEDGTDQKKEPEETADEIEKMVVDEEDGLKLTESAMAKQEQNIKSKQVPEADLKPSLKTDGSPILKKKVSFKRRSRDDSKDGDYEDIQAPPGETPRPAVQQKSKMEVLGNSQSMSVDEEKSYLDEKKIIKDTSLEEDYNRWSKLSDHEYEPVNPPPDNIVFSPTAPPTTTTTTTETIDTDQGLQQKPTSLASSTTSLERRMLGAEPETSPDEPFTVEEMQTEIENKFFNKPQSTIISKPEAKPSKFTGPGKFQQTVKSKFFNKNNEPTTRTIVTVQTVVTEDQPPKPKPEAPGKFQQAIKTQTDKFKTKLHEFKKPKLKKPNLQKFKIEKPKISLPKMPDAPKISLPSFSLPRRNKRPLKERQFSTESNAGDSKRNYFDFRTYPRLFKKKPKDELDSFSSKSGQEPPEFATVPRTKRNKTDDERGGRDTIRIPLHAEDSVESNEREDSVERRMASHIRYDEDIDIDDAYEKENQEIHTASPFSHGYNSRWNHGSFHPDPTLDLDLQEEAKNQQVTDLDSPREAPAPHDSFEINTSKEIHSSESSLGIHRRGVLEEIDSDEFFLRQKGISQDNIEVGAYLSSEIREAFKYPTNALADLQHHSLNFSYDPRASNQSLPETPTKRKQIKKPKRKKTPHVSQEQISFDDQDSEQDFDTEFPPSRPKRRSRRNKKSKEPEPEVIPYQETIPVEVPDTVRVPQEPEDDELMYENERMEGKEQPDIVFYPGYEERYDSEEDELVKPAAPPRKHRSLNFSEHDSILGDSALEREIPVEDIEIYKTEHEYIIPTPEPPPTKPPRTLSRSSSKSQEPNEAPEEPEEPPARPTRTRSSSRTRSITEEQILLVEEICVEEICMQDYRDCMGYAVVDKNHRREPPLPPPPQTPPRRKRSVQSSKSSLAEQRFFTVPRPLNDEPPTRPLRNYSTLGPSRPPRRKHAVNMTDEEKENIDITQYIEIEDEPNRDLHSGEVIQKMKDRPLPAPPRPPRKSRALQDITSLENIPTAVEKTNGFDKIDNIEETEISTQTEPLPDDFVSEENDKVIKPSEVEGSVTVERRLITPTQFSYEEETITHGALIVEGLNGAKILPDSQLTKREKPIERNIPITTDYDDETSEIPEEFTKLKDPPMEASQPSVIERIIERPVIVRPDSTTEVEVLKAQKLQVSDLDVDRLSVNELLASKIIVSEIDSGNIKASEISSKSGAVKFGEIELPPSVIQQLFERLQSVAQEQQARGPREQIPVQEESDNAGQKKNSD